MGGIRFVAMKKTIQLYRAAGLILKCLVTTHTNSMPITAPPYLEAENSVERTLMAVTVLEISVAF